MTEKQECNISFFFDEYNEENGENQGTKMNQEIDISLLLEDFEKTEIQNMSDLYVPHIINYHENFTVKELLLMCDYYGLTKECKAHKCKKEQIIYLLIDFESNPHNSDIVCKRKNMWFYMNELKNDKFMKKYVLW